MRISDWSSDVCSSDLGQFGRKRPGDLGRIGEPQILIGLQPSQAVADEHAAPDLLAEVRARPMRSRSQKAYRRARLAFGENGLPKIRFRHPLHAVALRKDARCDVFFWEGCQRPE